MPFRKMSVCATIADARMDATMAPEPSRLTTQNSIVLRSPLEVNVPPTARESFPDKSEEREKHAGLQ